MKIDFNSAMNEMADDGNEPAQQPAETPAQQSAAAQPATSSQPATTASAPAAAAPTAAAGATAVTPDTAEDQDPTQGRQRLLVGAGAGLALLAIIGGASLLGRGGDDAAGAAPAASPASSSAVAVESAAATPSAAPAPTAWAWTGADPAGTVIPGEQVQQWCKVGANDQVVSEAAMAPGSVVLVGPKGTKPPAQPPYQGGWRACTLGYQKPVAPQVIGVNELRDNDESLKKACSQHSGFDFDKSWKVLNADTRRRPWENTNHDASVALMSSAGWLVDCEMTVGRPAATLAFSKPVKGDKTCPRAQFVQRKDMLPNMPLGEGGKPDGMPPGMTPQRIKNLYWITAFGMVPDVGTVRRDATHASYNLGNGTEGDTEIMIKNGVAIANHTWFLKQGNPGNQKPMIHFWTKDHKKIYSCEAS